MLPRFVLCVLGIIPMYACRKELTGNIVTPSDELLGYQRVPAALAKKHNKDGFKSGDALLTNGQTGVGLYLPNSRDVVPGENKDDWYCRFWYNKKHLEKGHTKAWVPSHDKNGKPLWYNDKDIYIYVRTLKNWWSLERTVLLSIIDGKDWDNAQLMLPRKLVQDMALKVRCLEEKDNVPNVLVEYDNWHSNIKGDRVTVGPTPEIEKGPHQGGGLFGGDDPKIPDGDE